MRKYISIMLILTLTISLIGIFPVKADNGLSGSGTEKDRYLIYTADDFLKIKNEPNAHYMIMQDISLPSSFVPFELSGSVIGCKEDDMPKINVNLFSESSTTSNPLGLFSKLTGTAYIKNIHLTGSVTGTDYVGGFVGNSSSTATNALYNCINEATIRGNNYVGGLLSYHTAGKIENCINLGNVYGKQYVGGIAAYVNTVYVNLCQNFGNITASVGSVGGIAGRNYGYINECFNQGNIKGGNFVGGIIGVVNGKRDSTELYNMGTVTATNSISDNDCGGIIGGITIGASKYVKVIGAYNLGDVVSAGKNFNPIAPSFTPHDNTNYINITDGFYISEDKKEDSYEGTVAVDKSDSYLLEKINSISKKYEALRNTSNSDLTGEILSQLGAEMIIYSGYKNAAYINANNQAVLESMDENDPMITSKIVNSTLMVPVSFISKAFGADIIWKPENSEVIVKRQDKEIVFKINEKVAYLNGVKTDLGETAFIERGRTFVPFRVLCEFFEKSVFWHDSGIVIISSNPVVPSYDYIKKAKGLWIIPAEQISSRVKTAKPGDELIIANGVYKDVQIDIDFNGTESLPLTIRAETPGGVEFTGTSRFTATGSYITIRDFYFNQCISENATVSFVNTYYCRFTGNYLYMCGHTTNGQAAVVGISGNSKYNRMDHNTFERPHGMCLRLAINSKVSRERNVTDNRIDHNYFVDVRQCNVEMPTSSANGMEVVNLLDAQGYNIDNIIEYNRFEDIYGDGGEGICLKSDGNKVNYNTFINSYMSGLSMRKNENSEIIGNFFFKTKYGLRIFGNGHTFKNNYLFESYRSGFVAHAGSHTNGVVGEGPNQAASDFYAENNLTIYPGHAGIMLSDNFNADNGLTNAASNIIFKNNTFYLDKGTVLKDYRSNYMTYEENKVNLSGSATMGDANEGFETTDVPLVFDGEIWLPENMLDFDKQGLISLEECGPEDRWWESLLRYTPKYFFDIEPDTAPASLSPSTTTLRINTGEKYNLRGLRVTANYTDDYLYNKGIEKNFEDISYTTDNPELKIEDGFLSANAPGNYELNLGYKGLSRKIKVNVISEYSGNNLLSDDFEDADNSSYYARTGDLWEEKDGIFKSKQASQVINNSKVLKGNYEANFDITLTNDSGSGAIGGGFIFGYQSSPDLSFYTLRFGGAGVKTSGIYEVDSQVTLKSSEMLFDFEPNKKYNVTVRVVDDMVVVLVDGEIATILENFKNNEGKIGFISYNNNSVIIDNLNVISITKPNYQNEISDLNMTVERIDGTMALVNFEPLQQKYIYYRTYRNGCQINDSLDEDEGFTEVTLRVGEKIEYEVKGFDEYGNIVGRSSKSILFETNAKDEFFTISDLMIKTGNELDPYSSSNIKYRSRGLAEGLSTYSDRAYTISKLPDRFKDCGFIKMNNSDIKDTVFKNSAKTGDYMKFNINRSATVYVLAAGNITTPPEWLKDWNYESISDLELTTSNPTYCWSKHFVVPENEEITVYLGGFSSLSTAYHVYIKPDIMPEFVELKKIPVGLF